MEFNPNGVNLRAKTSKISGEFTGDEVSLPPRVEESMEQEGSTSTKKPHGSQVKSYKDALGPKVQFSYEDRDYLNDTWDGSLIHMNEA